MFCCSKGCLYRICDTACNHGMIKFKKKNENVNTKKNKKGNLSWAQVYRIWCNYDTETSSRGRSHNESFEHNMRTIRLLINRTATMVLSYLSASRISSVKKLMVKKTKKKNKKNRSYSARSLSVTYYLRSS